MTLRKSLLLFSLLFALVAVPSQLLADQFCQIDPAPYQYQSCGTVASANLFTVNGKGLQDGLEGVFQGYHADFAADVQALVWRQGQLVYTGTPSETNQQLSQFQTFTLVPQGIMQAGDQVEFVVNVDDVNGAQSYYSQDLAKNLDGLNHMWATTLDEAQCAPGMSGSCVFIGSEDLPKQEGSDFDYNDFKFWAYGVDATSVPEPSSILLLTGAPLAFAFGKLRRLF
jgi:hypothetical protein